MGNQQKQKSILELWNEHCLNKSKQLKNQSLKEYKPEIIRKNAIEVLDQAVHQDHLQSYKEDLKKFLLNMDPQKYAQQLAISVYLNHTQTAQFLIPQVNNLKEELIYKQIADHHLIKDLMNIWSEIFSNKYSIFQNQEDKEFLIKLIHSKDFVYSSLCNDIKYFIEYLEQMLRLIYEVQNKEKFKQLLIKMIFQNQNIKKIIVDTFEIYSLDKTQIFKRKLFNYKHISLAELRVPEQYYSDYPNTINQLQEILIIENPCDKFDLFSKLEQSMIKDIKKEGIQNILLELDKYYYGLKQLNRNIDFLHFQDLI
ncbi:unnamed protein product (macronuclear) [Paramecium tetraurelia]|uniref:Cullin N-terminal domain-containing protein n=1 Tax=Paramecium tetraurelia TaxID=5888 RepID=A0DSG8_PARTE|nr:uncharacterized protein GSPATT00019689001 [Paramecium tetraurelia]CAK85985.1 unnamed protein product [Paramecium tetraurelia]|eukprot:XP_001453382.1 hypothetical protein (macronuclear) [Paramecium tetraurelia strain d4-2]